MKNYFFIAFMALVICSCTSNVENQQFSTVAEQSQHSQEYQAKVLRVQQIIEACGHCSRSLTVLLLDDGNVFLTVDEFHENEALLREGDEVRYTKRSDGKVKEIVRCIYQTTKNSDE